MNQQYILFTKDDGSGRWFYSAPNQGLNPSDVMESIKNRYPGYSASLISYDDLIAKKQKDAALFGKK